MMTKEKLAERAMTAEQYPRVRKMPGCPICKQPKPVGCRICWTCNRTLKAKHDGDWGKGANTIIDRCEFILECAGVEP